MIRTGKNRERQAVIDKQKRKLAIKASRFKRLFESTEGAEVLKDLEDSYLKRSVIGPDAHATTVLAAQADVIIYINSLINFEYKGEDDEET